MKGSEPGFATPPPPRLCTTSLPADNMWISYSMGLVYEQKESKFKINLD
jgi:hypothetical protein